MCQACPMSRAQCLLCLCLGRCHCGDLRNLLRVLKAEVFATGNTVGPLLVGYIAEAFGYRPTPGSVAEMSPELRHQNASALGRALFFSCVVPSFLSRWGLDSWTWALARRPELHDALLDLSRGQRPAAGGYS